MRRLVLLTLAALVPALAGCAGDSATVASPGKPDLTVSAASSLKRAFSSYAASFKQANVRLSFGGSDQLAAQIREGARPDVFAAANMTLPEALYAAGLARRPTVFATNRLVIAVPASGSRIHGVADLARPGITIAAGSATVPVGVYTRALIARLPRPEAARIAANIRSAEPDVAGVVAKVAEGAVDAGFVYTTDVLAASGKLKQVELPPAARPEVASGAAIVTGSRHLDQARAFIAGLLAGSGRAALRAAGFGQPPSAH